MFIDTQLETDSMNVNFQDVSNAHRRTALAAHSLAKTATEDVAIIHEEIKNVIHHHYSQWKWLKSILEESPFEC